MGKRKIGHIGQTVGNNVQPSPSKKVKQLPKYRSYVFTLNNPVGHIGHILDKISEKWVYQLEVGENGTPHFQGYVYLKKRARITELRKHIECHWEVARNAKASIEYCMKKDKTYKDGPWAKNIPIEEPLEDELEGVKLFNWQQEIVNIIKTKPDKRKIYWYYETKGNMGKSSLVRHIAIKNQGRFIVVGGKKSDIFFGIQDFHKKRGVFPKIIFIDIPKADLNYISWGAIEKIKDGLFYSGKFESGMVLMNKPHVICFANRPPPNEDKMSVDRWVVTDIKESRRIESLEKVTLFILYSLYFLIKFFL